MLSNDKIDTGARQQAQADVETRDWFQHSFERHVSACQELRVEGRYDAIVGGGVKYGVRVAAGAVRVGERREKSQGLTEACDR